MQAMNDRSQIAYNHHIDELHIIVPCVSNNPAYRFDVNLCTDCVKFYQLLVLNHQPKLKVYECPDEL